MIPGVFSTLEGIRGVHWGNTMNTLGDTMMSVGGYHEYNQGMFSTLGVSIQILLFSE